MEIGDAVAFDAPRVLCIAGSPRHRGNSEQLLDAAVRGVRAAGGLPDVLSVVEYGIQICCGCNICSRGGVCIVADRMQDLYPRIDAAEAIVVSSPVYFATVPANLKALYDRCQPYWARRHLLGAATPVGLKRPGAFLVVRAGGDPFGYEAAVITTRSVFGVLGVEYAHELVVDGVDLPGAINQQPRALARAEEIGAQLVAQVLERRSR
jgi:multimeric flavodoxin WrbA